MAIRIGIDVGGTFTDVTGFDDEKGVAIPVRKYSSNPADPLQVMDEILRDLQADFGKDAVRLILHGSTAALNTLLEDRGVRAGLLTTAGFRDVYEIARQWRGDEVFNLFCPAPKMLLPRERIHEVHGRLNYAGEEVAPLDRADIENAVKALIADGVEAIAVCFLFAYANPAHELEAADIIRRIAPDLYLSLSHEVNPEWREYERTASTVANAYIGPPVARYLHGLEELSRRYFPAARTLMMKSDGGAGSARMLSEKPIQTVMSGPVAGVIGARYLGALTGRENLITFDVGGTSSDMAVLPGEPLFRTEVNIARHPLRTQTVDIETIGAGGGSIASIELGGVLKVGPRSAGAIPGPACYDRGGTEPALTDALVVLGHLNLDSLLGGAMAIAGAKAAEAVDTHVAKPLNMPSQDAAWGILTVLAANCTAAMRMITVERGYDPREFTLVPFGGMGPAIAGRIAADLGIGRILVPRDPGTFSAWGMLVADVRQERSVTRLMPLDAVQPVEIESLYTELEEQVAADLEGENFTRESMILTRYAGMRYRGQSYEVTVTAGPVRNTDDIAVMTEAFHTAHKRRYGHMAANETIEIVTVKVVGAGLIDKPDLPQFPAGAKTPAPQASRKAWFGDAGWLDIPVHQRDRLAPGAEIFGPAIVEEKTSTIVIYPRQTARVDSWLNMEIEVQVEG
ncbi:MAG: hydantoinase/oxoprolinase family protein [Hyphomicrobiales bacterium]|nr:hydantoinase/oxoprolinase family protein [Hyphomicrobiales bacterium]